MLLKVDRHRQASTLLCIFFACLLLGSLASCSGQEGSTVNLEPSQEMNDAFKKAINDRESYKLSDTTPWDWDSVFIFGEGTTARQLEELFDNPLIKDDRFKGDALFVFLNNDVVVRVVPSWSDWFIIPTQQKFSNLARVELQPSGSIALVTFSDD